MAKIDTAFFDLSKLEEMANNDTVIHRIDPRIKVLVASMFVICVVSFHKYTISAILPFGLFLIIVMGLAEIPAFFLLKKIVLVSPFAIMVGIFNPLFDQQPIMVLGAITITGGCVSFVSILLRFGLCVGAVLVLIASTGFNTICLAMVKLGMPKIFAVQLLMLYRYIFVLIEEGLRMYQAMTLRTFHGRAIAMKTYMHLAGQLLLRTLDRAQRIHLAMLCRGFDGNIRIRQSLRMARLDIFFLAACFAILLLMRCYNIPAMFGRLITGIT